ncbi:MAG TPA: YdcF family protein [Thermodesulfobacteriota bacterium]|nr:YdcF family protein [Thermodesulfobacteriota bacterium]
MKIGKWPYILPVVFSLAFLSYLFLSFAGSVSGRGPSKNSADAIVVLTGGTGRVDLGLEFLRKGRGTFLVLSGVDRDADMDSIFLNGVSEGERLKIFLDKNSRSTYENAIEVRKLMKEKGFDSMLLITSTYHMKRACYIFKRIMPPDVRIEPYPVESPNFDTKRWWRGRGVFIAGEEFLKYSWYYLRFGFEDIIGLRGLRGFNRG